MGGGTLTNPGNLTIGTPTAPGNLTVTGTLNIANVTRIGSGASTIVYQKDGVSQTVTYGFLPDGSGQNWNGAIRYDYSGGGGMTIGDGGRGSLLVNKIAAGGAVTIGGNATIGGGLTTTGGATIGNGLTVNGNTTWLGSTHISGDLTVTGNIMIGDWVINCEDAASANGAYSSVGSILRFKNSVHSSSYLVMRQTKGKDDGGWEYLNNSNG